MKNEGSRSTWPIHHALSQKNLIRYLSKSECFLVRTSYRGSHRALNMPAPLTVIETLLSLPSFFMFVQLYECVVGVLNCFCLSKTDFTVFPWLTLSVHFCLSLLCKEPNFLTLSSLYEDVLVLSHCRNRLLGFCFYILSCFLILFAFLDSGFYICYLFLCVCDSCVFFVYSPWLYLSPSETRRWHSDPLDWSYI